MGMGIVLCTLVNICFQCLVLSFRFFLKFNLRSMQIHILEFITNELSSNIHMSREIERDRETWTMQCIYIYQEIYVDSSRK